MKLKALVLSFFHIIIGVIFLYSTLNTNYYIALIDWASDVDSIKDILLCAICTFLVLFVSMGLVCHSILAIWYMISYYYYTFFYNKKEIHLIIDENQYIRDSYVELKNGRTIPIKINKVKWKKPKETKESTGEE